ncbi:TPA: Phr family secreted Rap phosphatase inhibitor [Bacillus pseudomycoides]|nr:Phr family secreted Rap phosphatase inhibitor [Bacillus pseudomycoides]
MFKKVKKIGAIVLGLSVIGIVSIGLNSSFTYQAGHADTPAPQNPDLAYSHGNTGGSPADNRGDGGGVVTQESHADFPAPAYNKGDTPVQQA